MTLVDNFQLQNPTVLNSLGTLKVSGGFAVSSVSGTHTNIFTLPYTSANAVVQQLASGTVSVNPFGVTIYEGVAKLNPPMDNWINSYETPAITITDPQYQFTQQAGGTNLTNAGDFQSIVGTTISTPTLPALRENATSCNSISLSSVSAF